MYRPAAFAVDDLAVLHDFIRERAFATLALVAGGAVNFAYAPVVLDTKQGPHGALRFHLARSNPIAQRADGQSLQVSFLGPDAYVSPDWYRNTSKVPTWNYIAVEGRGKARKLDGDELRQLLVDLTAEHERMLLPKEPWTIGKLSEQRMTALTGAIDGFEVRLESLTGKFKLSQNLDADDFDGALRGLDARGDAASAAVANAMRKATGP